MAKKKIEFICTECGERFPKWIGQCSNCKKWNTIVEIDKQEIRKQDKYSGYAGGESSEIISLSNVDADVYSRDSTGLNELDRVLGGDGVVSGGVTLIGGDPGVGKSTILIQVLSYMSKNNKALYISGEESAGQIKMRAERLKLDYSDLHFLAETNVEKIIEKIEAFNPKIVVIDSIQTIFSYDSNSAPGTTSQTKETTAQLTRYAKQKGVSMFIIGHVTKDGAIAGPKALEHIVDTVLYFEGEQGSRYRMIRAVKNRFGEVNELGVFAMMEEGLKEVKNPSAIFLSNYNKAASGTTLMVTKEGSRPLLVELQCLLAKNPSDNVRRMSLGIDRDRLILMLALLQRKAKISLYNQDVYVSVVGGIKIAETASDVPLVLSIISSYKEKPLPKGLIAFGEIGLTGEVRPVPNGEERIKEALKHGLKTIVVPKMNVPKSKNLLKDDVKIIGISDLDDLLKIEF